MTNVLIDCEYVFTAAMRDGMIPNYKNIIGMFNKTYENVVFYAYFVGSKKKKKSVADFLIKNGIDYVNVLDYWYATNTQIVGTTIAIDVMKIFDETSTFVFLTGDDYMIPIADYLYQHNIKPHVYYFPVILSRELENIDCKFIKLSNSYFMYRDKEKDGYNTGN